MKRALRMATDLLLLTILAQHERDTPFHATFEDALQTLCAANVCTDKSLVPALRMSLAKLRRLSFQRPSYCKSLYDPELTAEQAAAMLIAGHSAAYWIQRYQLYKEDRYKRARRKARERR